MKRTLIKDLIINIDNEVYIAGFIENIREFKKFRFLFVRDRSGTGQVVLPNEVYSGKINYEDVVGIKGDVIEQQKSLKSGLEVLAKDLDFLSRGKKGSCFVLNNGNELNLETQLDRKAASLRISTNQKVFEVQSAVMFSLSQFLHENGFIEVKTPKIISSALEGGANLFEVDYFGKKAYLSQSPQLYHQMLMASFERVFEIGPCFRAEDYATSRHINEFTSLDTQIGFIESHYDIMELLENMLSTLKDFMTIPSTIPKKSFDEVIRVLNRNRSTRLNGDEKRKLGEIVKKEEGSDFLFLYGFPREITNFYVMPEGDTSTRSFKLLYKGQEICTGGQRIHDYNQLIESMAQKEIDLNNFRDYVEAFKCGIPPHGGFCIGLNRLTSLILNLNNVKEAALFPRDPKRITP